MKTRTRNQVVVMKTIANKDVLYITTADIVDVNISDSTDPSIAMMITITIINLRALSIISICFVLACCF